MKMEVPELKSPHHDNGGTLKLQMEFPSYSGSAAEMDRIGKSNIRITAEVIAVLRGREKQHKDCSRRYSSLNRTRT